VAQVLTADGKATGKTFIDVRSRIRVLNEGFDERGLLGLTFHPKFRENRRVFVFYSAPKRPAAPADWDHTGHVSEFKTREGNLAEVDPTSERVLMEIDEPYFNHNGGAVVFGPDGYLYISSGDGGNANDEGRRPIGGNGQDRMSLLGKILRIDVDQGVPYGIPKDNPFPDGAEGRPEIFAYGLRNPWRISFDRGGKHELFAADVGQELFEEVDIIVKGGNYGWRLREGFEGFDPKQTRRVPTESVRKGAVGEPLLDPIVAYKNASGWRPDADPWGISVTGGYVYRGKAIPGLVGKYVFGDWSRNRVKGEGVLFVASPPAAGAGGRWSLDRLALATHPEGHLGAYLTAFGEDEEGELYVLTNDSNTPLGQTGKAVKLVLVP
jgi:hypothetical protein